MYIENLCNKSRIFHIIYVCNCDLALFEVFKKYFYVKFGILLNATNIYNKQNFILWWLIRAICNILVLASLFRGMFNGLYVCRYTHI